MAGFIPDSESVSWCTPPWILEAVREAFAVWQIGLDPCSNERSLVGAEREFRLPETDGLSQPWNARTIFVNPPFGTTRLHRETHQIFCEPKRKAGEKSLWSRMGPETRAQFKTSDVAAWLAKCAEARRLYGAQVQALVPVTPETIGWRESVWPEADAICFFRSRLKFIDFETGMEAEQVIPKPMAMIYWGPEAERFEKAFEKHCTIIPCGPTLARLREAAGRYERLAA
jgi:hypothetical protein